MKRSSLKIGVLVSGKLGENSLRFLLDNHSIEFVCTDKNSEGIIDLCKSKNLPIFIGNPRKGKVQPFIKDKKIDVLLSINYLFLIEEDLINLPEFYAINIHGSLLPKYRGRTPHVWAIINNERYTGITAHLIDKDCDTGEIVAQIQIDINEEDTGASILKKYDDFYPVILKEIIDNIQSDSIFPRKQDETQATYFGKRTPEDGEINWDWQRERIKNWIRAQAFPYPGAFTHYGDQKVIIDRVVFSNFGFDFSLENGVIIQTTPEVIVKTPNGALTLKEIRNKNQYNFVVGNKFETKCK